MAIETKTLIDASATIVTVHKLKKGNVYRRLVTSSYQTDRVVYGVVTDVAHNGSDAFISSLEFDVKGASTVEPQVFGTTTELMLFSCTPEEFQAAASDARHGHVRDINQKASALEQAESALSRLDEMIASSQSQPLSSPETVVPAVTGQDS